MGFCGLDQDSKKGSFPQEGTLEIFQGVFGCPKDWGSPDLPWAGSGGLDPTEPGEVGRAECPGGLVENLVASICA